MASGTNGFDSKQLQSYLSEIDEADYELDRLRDDFKGEAEPFRERIKDILREAKNEGVNMAAFRVVLAEHRSERRAAKRVEALDAGDRMDYEAMVDALGVLADTPLGKASLARVRVEDEEIARRT